MYLEDGKVCPSETFIYHISDKAASGKGKDEIILRQEAGENSIT